MVLFKLKLKIIAAVVLFFVVLLPTSDISTERDFGILIRNHKQAEKEYGDLYQDILAISTVNHDNNLSDKFELSESVSYLRRVYKRKYKLVSEEHCHTNAKGDEVCNTIIREVLVSTKEYQGEELISLAQKKLSIPDRDTLLRNGTFKDLLKFKYIFPEETSSTASEEYVIKYEIVRLTRQDIIYPDDKQEWFLFLAEEGIDALYNDMMHKPGSGSIVADGSSVHTPVDPSKSNIVEFAKQYLGRPYRWGAGIGNTSSFDCSSYVAWIYKKCYGVNLPRVSYDQYKRLNKVDKSNLQTGDLVFFHTGFGNVSNPITHVGMYIGDGKFIHASSSGGVKISDLNSPYYKKTYRGAGRL